MLMFVIKANVVAVRLVRLAGGQPYVDGRFERFVGENIVTGVRIGIGEWTAALEFSLRMSVLMCEKTRTKLYNFPKKTV